MRMIMMRQSGEEKDYLFMAGNLCFLFRFLVICNVNLCENE